MVAGNPVWVQSPARTRLRHAVLAGGRLAFSAGTTIACGRSLGMVSWEVLPLVTPIRRPGLPTFDIAAIAEAAGVTPTELHHLFRRWAGLTPKAFLQAITLDSARTLLRASASVLDAAYEVGLSGPGRLHDLFVTHEAMSPGDSAAVAT